MSQSTDMLTLARLDDALSVSPIIYRDYT